MGSKPGGAISGSSWMTTVCVSLKVDDPYRNSSGFPLSSLVLMVLPILSLSYFSGLKESGYSFWSKVLVTWQ